MDRLPSMTSPISGRVDTARTVGLPNYVYHSHFEGPSAESDFSPTIVEVTETFEDKHMPDEVTRDFAKRMHYAVWRAHQATTSSERQTWFLHYTTLRDRIVLGNRKLIYRAVRRRHAVQNRIDDLIGDCQIVLIQAVAAFNPWLGIRFSTYAYTCLVRAISRLAQRFSTDWLARSMPLDLLPDDEPLREEEEIQPAAFPRLDIYFREDHPLLSSREKAILSRRFNLNEESPCSTLEQVGREMGLSKERVRQVQASALGKLRKALTHPAPTNS